MQPRQVHCNSYIVKRSALSILAFLVTQVLSLRLGVQSEKREKPALSLTFEANLRSERLTGPGDETTELDERHVALDAQRFSVALLPHRSSDHRASSGGIVVDVMSNLQTQIEPFFEGEVCFAFDLDNRRHNTAIETEDAAMAFKAMVDDVVGVPLALYEKADLHEGSVNISGQLCDVWTARLNSSIRLPSAREFYALAAKLRLSYSVLQGAKHSVQADMILEANTSFCVDEFGKLYAANTSQRAVLHDSDGEQRLMRYDIARTTLDDVKGIDERSAALFQPGRKASGGRCINLTSSSAYHEIRKELNDGHRIERINKEAHGSWEAASYHHWRDFSVKDIIQTLGTNMRPLRLPLKHATKKCNQGNPLGRRCRFADNVDSPPHHFDARKHWSQCDSIRTVRNQGSCGSCWAVAAASVLADRVCIGSLQANMSDASSNFQKLRLSPQYILDCDEDGGGCNGGHLDDAWEFLETDGIPEESCDPYAYCANVSDPQCGREGEAFLDESGMQATMRKCPGKCQGQAVRTFRAQVVYAVSAPGDVPRIQQEIYSHGPVEAAFFVFSDFHSYRRGTYSRTPSAVGPLGGHAVRLVGWGVDKHEKDFWTVANSFGAHWGMKGFFRILRGTNECGIETMPAAGLPSLDWQKQASAA